MSELPEFGVAEFIGPYAGWETTPLEVVRSLLARIGKHERRPGPIAALCGERAMSAAAATGQSVVRR